jgi:hypothetical protein
MKKLMLLATMLLLAIATLPLQARATTFYVKSSYPGNDNNAGTSALAPKRTLTGGTVANPSIKATARPGDVVRVYPGTYTWSVIDSAGSNPTGNGYITVIGTHPAADPLSDSLARDQIQITGSTEPPGQSYISIKGVTIGPALHFGESSDRDSITYCTLERQVEFYGGDYNVVRFCIGRGARINIASLADAQILSSVGNTIDYNHFWKLGFGITAQPHIIEFGKNPDLNAGEKAAYCESLTFTRNRLFINFDPNAGDVSPWYLYRTKNSTILHNYIQINMLRAAGWAAAPRLRDSTFNVTFRGDTLIGYGPGGLVAMLSSHGSENQTGLQVWGNTLDSCFINYSACQGTSDITFQEHMNNWTITNNVIATNGRALQPNHQVKGRTTIDHNTLVGNAANGVVDFISDGTYTAWPDSAVTFTNNIVATWDAAVAGAGPDVALVRYDAAAFDSGSSMRSQDNLVARNNLFAIGPYSATPGDRAVAIKNGASWLYSTPGDSTSANPKGLSENRWNIDSLSVYGSAQFAEGSEDSTRSVEFSALLGYLSRARGIGTSSSDAGALAYVAKPLSSVTPPGALDFYYGVADTQTVTIHNSAAADGDLLLSTTRHDGIYFSGYDYVVQVPYKPASATPGGPGVYCNLSDVSNLDVPMPVDSDYPIVVWYDGTGALGTRYIRIACNDPLVPLSTPPGCAEGHWITIPIIVH